MKRNLLLQKLTVAVCGFTPFLSLAADDFNIEVSNNDVAVEANNANLKELLLELEKLTGIPIKFISDSEERVSLSVGMTTVENAIAKITPNHLIVHETIDGKKVVKELIVIAENSGTANTAASSSFLPNGQPAPAIEPTTGPQVSTTPTGTPQPLDPSTEPEQEPQVPEQAPVKQVN